jgi:hypothetical protein
MVRQSLARATGARDGLGSPNEMTCHLDEPAKSLYNELSWRS